MTGDTSSVAQAEARRALFAGVKLLALDIDGTLTDGKTTWLGETTGWVQTYSVRDGESILRLQAAGVPVVPISRNRTTCARVRMSHLKLPLNWLAVEDKISAMHEVSQAYDIPIAAICYLADGREDVPILEAVGVPCAVADAHPFARNAARFITHAGGGANAVEEIVELILASTGR